MKKIISIILTLVCFCSFTIVAFAANAELTADDVSVSPGDSFEVTYSIKNNPGVMGFAFELSYDASAFDVISVTKSESIESGYFNDSVGTSKPGTVKIVWTGTENLNGDMILFSVKIQTIDNISGEYSIKIKCLEDDTFNEKWQDVKIDCDQINIYVGNEKPTTIWQRVIFFFKRVISRIINLFN